MARNNGSILEILMVLPWWVSVVFSIVVYTGLAIIAPAIVSDNPLLMGLKQALPQSAPYFALLFLLPAIVSAINAWRKRKLLDNQKHIDSIRALSWKEFEELVAEAYRRKGYRVTENHFAGADGGVDIRLENNGHIHLVQCKQWRSQKVGVSVIREMYGVMTSENASSVIVITSGFFTQEALNFAIDKPIDLIDGPQLESLISQVQAVRENHGFEAIESSPRCPRCGSQLMIRTAKRGQNAGSKFFGCSAFPKCRYTQAYPDK